MVILLIIIKYRSKFKEQKEKFSKSAVLKAQITENEYRNKYTDPKFDFDYEQVDLNQMQEQVQIRIQANTNDDEQEQLIDNRRQSNYSQSGQKMKHMLEKQKTTSAKKYEELNKLNKQDSQNDFNYFKTIVDFKYISASLFLDLDFLSDCMAVCNCYALSRSKNLKQEIRNDLDFYFKCSLTILFVSVLPKINCYFFLLLRLIVTKMEIIKKDQNQETLTEQKSCLKKLIFHFYRLISRFYGINYNEDNGYVFKSKDITKDIQRLFYVNHEDMFTAEQLNPAKETVDLLVYDEMEKNTHSSLRINLFRTFFENTPQLALQLMMVYTLQQSNIEDCKKTDFAFYQSIITTSLSMLSGLISILLAVYKKASGGDLVIQNMNEQFMKYLIENKQNNATDVFKIDDKIDFYPKMIESLYKFLLQNTKCKEVQFTSNVIFKGDIDDCFKVIEFGKEQDSMEQIIKMEFENVNKSKQQMMIELTVKKIFEELIIKDSKIECKSDQKKLIVKQEYEFGHNVMSFVELVKDSKVVIQKDGVDLQHDEFKIQADQTILLGYDLVDGLLSNNYVERVKQLLKVKVIVINDEIFSWDLFRQLLQIRVIMMFGQFKIKDERIRKMIEEHKQNIYNIKGNIKAYDDYQGYFKMREQLNGLRVELDQMYCYELFCKYYGQQSQDDQQIIRNIYSFQNTRMRMDDRYSVQQNIDLIKQFLECRIGWLDNYYRFGLNDYVSNDVVDAIKQMKSSNPQLKIIHRIDDNKKQEVDDQQSMLKFKDIIVKYQVPIHTIEFSYRSQFNLEQLDQGFERYIDQSECAAVFKHLNTIRICIYDDNAWIRMTDLEQKQQSIVSKYQIQNIEIISKWFKPCSNQLTSASRLVCQYYTQLKTIKFSAHEEWMINDEDKDVVLDYIRYNHPQIQKANIVQWD